MHALEQLFYSTTKILVPGSFGQEIFATGFLFQYWVEEGFCQWVVTNKHVVEKLIELGIKDVAFAFHDKTIEENGEEIPDKTETKFEAKDFTTKVLVHEFEDVAVYEFPWNDLKSQFIKCVSTDLIPTKEQWEDLNPIQELHFVGYPDGIHDTFNNLPVRRTAVTSSPIRADYKGKEQILVEAMIFPGSSGSPVFLYKPSMSTEMDDIPIIGSRFYFVGVISEFIQSGDGNKEKLHLGVVTKYSALLDLIKSDVGRDFYRHPKKV